jgi:hypothetical protein
MSAAISIPLAHFGHWYISLPIFMGPVIVLAGWLLVVSWKDRRRDQ